MNFYTMKETRVFLESIGMPVGDLWTLKFATDFNEAQGHSK